MPSLYPRNVFFFFFLLFIMEMNEKHSGAAAAQRKTNAFRSMFSPLCLRLIPKCEACLISMVVKLNYFFCLCWLNIVMEINVGHCKWELAPESVCLRRDVIVESFIFLSGACQMI